MGLIKCPDCGKMISERVDACPFCGCPSKFFDNSVKKEEKEIPDSSSKLKDITFKFKNAVITYPGGSEKYAEILGEFFFHASVLYTKYLNAYHESDLDKIMGRLKLQAEKDIDNTIEAIVKDLYSRNIRITAEEFKNRYDKKYNMDFASKLKPIEKAISEVQDEKYYRQQQREAEKMSRGRWQGGGFGVSGAVKGAVTAGLMNMASDSLHSFGDASRANRDQDIINRKLSGIAKSSEYEKIYANAMWSSILDIGQAFLEELMRHKLLVSDLPCNYKEANSVFTTTMEYESDEDKRFAGIIESIGLYPFEKSFYNPIFEQLHESDCDFYEFISFWHIKSYLGDIESDYQKKKEEEKRRIAEKENFESQFGLVGFNYEDKSGLNYKLIRKKIHDQAKLSQELELPTDAVEFLVSCSKEERFPYCEYQDWLPAESDLFDFFFALKLDGVLFKKNLTNIFWLYGYPTKESATENDFISPTEAQKSQLEMNSGALLLYNDNSMFSNGKSGIALTEKKLYNLKTQEKICSNDIRNIVFYKNILDKYVLSFKGQSDKIDFTIPDSSKYYISDREVNHLICMLSILLVRYAGNSYLWNDKMMVDKQCIQEVTAIAGLPAFDDACTNVDKQECSQCGKLIGKNVMFCNFCGATATKGKEVGEKNYSETLRLQQSNQAIQMEKTNRTICSKCGKIISKSVRFCNFCGNPALQISNENAINNEFVVCNSCGKSVNNKIKFCVYCGNKME